MSLPPESSLRQHLDHLSGLARRGMHPGVVLAGAAAIDEELKELILKKMDPLTKTMETRIFNGYAPLSNISAKIDVSLALGIVSKKIYEDLRLVNKIRVIFAHSSKLRSLHDEPAFDLFARLVETISRDDADLAEKFISALKAISSDIQDHLKQKDGDLPLSSS